MAIGITIAVYGSGKQMAPTLPFGPYLFKALKIDITLIYILPDAAREKPTQGRVLAIGPGALKDDGSRAPMSVDVGDTVVYNQYGGTDVKLEEGDCKILREADLLAKIK